MPDPKQIPEIPKEPSELPDQPEIPETPSIPPEKQPAPETPEILPGKEPLTPLKPEPDKIQ